MKFVVSSDWHPDKSTDGFSRYDDVKRATDEIVGYVCDNDIDAFFFAGDLSDPFSPGVHLASSLGVNVAARLDGMGVWSGWIVGNHDVVEDGSGSHSLMSIAAAGFPTVSVFDKPAFEPHDALGIDILALPYTSFDRSYDPEAFVIEARKANPPAKGRTVVVLAHLNISGITSGSETHEMPRGRDVFLPVEAIKRAYPDCIIFNGHYHTRQKFRDVYIPGSVANLSHGEEMNVPGFAVVEL